MNYKSLSISLMMLAWAVILIVSDSLVPLAYIVGGSGMVVLIASFPFLKSKVIKAVGSNVVPQEKRKVKIKIYGAAIDGAKPEPAGENYCWVLFSKHEMKLAGIYPLTIGGTVEVSRGTEWASKENE